MQKSNNVYNLVKVAVCVSILSVVSYIVIPMPPSGFTLQTVAVNLIALILAPVQAGTAVLVYLLIGLMGLPVFSGGVGGAGKLFGPAGGFYFGFLLAAVLMSLLRGKDISFKRYCAVTAFVGIPLQHICAIIMMCFHNGFNVKGAFMSISLPFILGDIVKAVAASALAVSINRALRKHKM